MEPIDSAPVPAFATRWPLLLAALLGLARVATAQPVPALTNVPPVYLKQGDSQQLTLTGQDLADVTAVVVPDPRGLVATLLGADKIAGADSTRSARGQQPRRTDQPGAADRPRRGRGAMTTQPVRADSSARIRLAASADAPLGVRELRLVTKNGVTAPVVVAVGQYPAFADKGSNNTPEQAQPVELPAAILGKIETGGDADCYRFEAKRGQHLIFDVHAARVGSPLQPVMTVHDAAGRELPHSDEFHDGDPMAVFDAPEDGSYVLQVRDLQFRGGGDYSYRIDAGPIPYLESLMPMSGRRGQKIEVTAVGHNLAGATKVTLDLTGAEAGPMPVRVKTDLGLSNEVSFVVTDLAQVTEKEPNDAAEQATPVPLPSEVTGVLQKEGDEDFYKFHVATRQQVTIGVEARRTGSPVDALLTLKTAKGELVEQNNGSGEAEARIARKLEPGEYVLSVRDLTYGGGPGYGYRISLAAGGLPPDFIVRFLPDAPRVARGGNTKLWCEVVRANGYKGDVAITLDGLPPGVTAGPAVMSDQTSGIFTLSASPDAALGTVPMTIKAAGTVGGLDVTRTGEPELNGRVLQQAYVTVLEAAPANVEAVALTRPEQLRDYGKQVADLYAKLNTSTPQLVAAQAEWEKTATTPVEWKVLEPRKLTSASNVPLTKQPDGSILAGGNVADKDTYTVTAETDLKGITGIRLEVLPDDSLPAKGPGRAPNGNFVLSKFAATTAPKSDPAPARPLAFATARATFEQANFAVGAALDGKSGGGWALMPELGKPQTAYFFLRLPAGSDAGTTLTFTLDQQYGQLHTLGKFRLSVTNDPNAAKQAGKPLPAPIAAVLKTPADQRTVEQKAQLAAYYRTIAPELAAERARLDGLRNGIGPYAEIARLEGVLNANTTALANEQREWEQTALSGGWTVPDVTQATAANGTLLVRESDGSYAATGVSPATDTYTLVANTPLKQITAIKVEALPDERFPGNGPGRGPNGNFILSRLQLTARPWAADGKFGPAATATPVAFRTATATFEQQGWQAVGALDDRNDTGWGVAPNTGRPVSATFVAKHPVPGGEGGMTLNLTLEQQSNQPQHTLGRFRVYVTGSPTPDESASLPAEVVAILKVPADKRNDYQKAAIAGYYRSIAPSLREVRERLAELKARAAPLPLTAARNRAGFIPVPVVRTAEGAGDVQVTLEGFSSGRDPATRMPMPVARNLAVNPLTVTADEAFGRLTFRVNPNSELGTRMVVLRAETKVGNDTYVQYSPAFPLTVTEK